MADSNPMDRGPAPDPGAQDKILEQAVLAEILALHPAQLTLSELALKMDASVEDFAAKDAVERAVRELTRDGLLHCDCRRIWPTRAALRFEGLFGPAEGTA